MRLSVIIALLTLSLVDAFPSGAGGCQGGMAAVGGNHLDDFDGDRLVGTGPLSEPGLVATIGGFVLDPNVATDLPISEDLTIAVEAMQIPFKGILIRVEAPDGVDTSAALSSGEGTINTDVCTAPVVGITHMDNETKLEVTGTIRFDEQVDDVIIDITSVFVNDDTGSAYVYNEFRVNFRADTATNPNSTEAPTNSPSTMDSGGGDSLSPATTPPSTLFPSFSPYPTSLLSEISSERSKSSKSVKTSKNKSKKSIKTARPTATPMPTLFPTVSPSPSVSPSPTSLLLDDESESTLTESSTKSNKRSKSSASSPSKSSSKSSKSARRSQSSKVTKYPKNSDSPAPQTSSPSPTRPPRTLYPTSETLFPTSLTLFPTTETLYPTYGDDSPSSPSKSMKKKRMKGTKGSKGSKGSRSSKGSSSNGSSRRLLRR